VIINQILKEQVLSRLAYDNPWWVTGKTADDHRGMTHRPYTDLFYPLVADDSLRRAVILMGPRRVGKTVMIFHTIDRLIKNGVDPQKIIYLSIDTPIYNGIPLEDLFSMAREVLKQSDSYDGFYVFYDEIQYLKDWEVHLKSLVDSYRKVKFVASGSAAAALKMKSNESGAGRFTDFMLPPMTFYEYITLLQLGRLIVKSKDTNISGPYDTIDINELNRHFIDYINFGGYPEVVFSEKIRANPGQYIRHDIIDKVLLRDLPSLYGISDTQELNRLFVYIAWRSGLEFSYEAMSQDAGIKKEMLKRYIEYFEAAFLIKIVHKTDQNAKRMQRATAFKIYLTNPSLRCALFSPIEDSDDMMGGMVETAVFSQWAQGGKDDIFYANWAEGRDRGEVDVVMLDSQTQKPYSVVEVKWSDRYVDSPKELKSLIRFVEANTTINGRVICTSKTKSGTYPLSHNKISFIPTAIYAYWVSSFSFQQKIGIRESPEASGVMRSS
jgi:predicted AAA+ superfamily ATPase